MCVYPLKANGLYITLFLLPIYLLGLITLNPCGLFNPNSHFYIYTHTHTSVYIYIYIHFYIWSSWLGLKNTLTVSMQWG